MLKLLIRKQLSEVFKGYFYNTKKNKARSKAGIVGMFLFFAVIMVGVLGGMFTYLSLTLCRPLQEAGMGWLYFVLMSGIAVVLGAFGSIFNTYAGLYLSKDNDLLLSLPIPVKHIIASRLINVFLLGTMYSAVAIIPALIVYWAVAGVTAARVTGGIVLMLIIFLFVLVLSCLLGWCVAKISLKLKNRSFVTVLASLLFIGAYYVVYFKASSMIQDLIGNAVAYGEKIRGAANWLYLFGRTGEGDLKAAAVCFAAVLVLLALTWSVLKKTFLAIATASASTGKKKYREKAVREKTPFEALLSREFAKFTSAPNYMLNCGLGILFIPAFGVFLLLKGDTFMPVLEELFSEKLGVISVIFITALITLGSMNDMTSPSVSLEGKNIWIPQSLPVAAKTVLRAKTAMQLILSGIPMLFALVCGLFVLPCTAAEKALVCLIVLLNTAFSALFGAAIGVRMPNLTWTNEMIPIKQSGAVTIALFSGWGIAALFAGIYFIIGYELATNVYLGLWAVLFAAADIILMRWLDTKGAKRFSEL